MLRARSEKALLGAPPPAADAERFKSIFGVELKDYWEGILKLDVVKFDTFIKPRKNESTAQAIVRKYGQDACNYIRGLL
jgi:hypothetical protein